MTTFIKAKLRKSDDQTNIDKYRLAASVTEYHIVPILFFLRIIISKFMMIRQLFDVKNIFKICNKNKICFKLDARIFWSEL